MSGAEASKGSVKKSGKMSVRGNEGMDERTMKVWS